jgi:lysophospholipase L1-like esterase
LNNGTFFESIGNFAITSVATTSAVAGSEVADVITRSDNNTIPNNVITDIILQVGINDCHAYYLNSTAQQASDFATGIESLYQKLKAKQQFTHIFWGNLPQIYIPYVDTGIHQAWIDAIPYHYIYNNALAQLAINHSDVTIVDISSVSDGATAANYQTGDGLHPSALGYYLIIQLFIAAIKTKFP